MDFGNIICVLEDRFGVSLDIDTLKALYHAGELTPLLPDGSWWTARATEDGDIVSIESIATAELEPFFSWPRHDGGLHIRAARTDGSNHLSYSYAPNCERVISQ